jgi:hypothetical protein
MLRFIETVFVILSDSEESSTREKCTISRCRGFFVTLRMTRERNPLNINGFVIEIG